MKGNNIISINSINFVNDRISSPSNLNGIYIKGGNLYSQNAAAYTSYLTLPTDTYFCLTAASITFWINVVAPVPYTNIARIIDFSDATNKSNGIALYIKPANLTFTNVGLELKSSGSAQNLNDPTVGFAPQTWTHVAVAFSSTGSSITINIYYNGVVAYTTTLSISLPASCPLMTTNFIGKSTSPTFNDVNLDAYLNDIKLFNTSLNASQVLNQYADEKCYF